MYFTPKMPGLVTDKFVHIIMNFFLTNNMPHTLEIFDRTDHGVIFEFC